MAAAWAQQEALSEAFAHSCRALAPRGAVDAAVRWVFCAEGAPQLLGRLKLGLQQPRSPGAQARARAARGAGHLRAAAPSPGPCCRSHRTISAAPPPLLWGRCVQGSVVRSASATGVAPSPLLPRLSQALDAALWAQDGAPEQGAGDSGDPLLRRIAARRARVPRAALRDVVGRLCGRAAARRWDAGGRCPAPHTPTCPCCPSASRGSTCGGRGGALPPACCSSGATSSPCAWPSGGREGLLLRGRLPRSAAAPEASLLLLLKQRQRERQPGASPPLGAPPPPASPSPSSGSDCHARDPPASIDSGPPSAFEDAREAEPRPGAPLIERLCLCLPGGAAAAAALL